MVRYRAIIIADGIPTISESIKFINKKGITDNCLCISIEKSNEIFKTLRNSKLEIKPFYKFKKKIFKANTD